MKKIILGLAATESLITFRRSSFGCAEAGAQSIPNNNP